MAERLQKLISSSGLMSRRAAEEAIRNGRVTVNGRIASLGEQADFVDCILLDGKRINKPEHYYYIALNKPRGYVTTMKDEKGRKTVCDLVKTVPARVYPVGRLDMDSEGLLILTNDGAFAEKLSHPSGGHSKTYIVSVTGKDMSDSLPRLMDPFYISGSRVQAVSMETIHVGKENAVISITIREGKNRQIRKMCELSSLKVKKLQRVKEGPVILGDLPAGTFRYLSEEEVKSVFEG